MRASARTGWLLVLPALALLALLAVYPVAYGRTSVSFGHARVRDTGTLTLRCRARDLSGEAAARLLRMVAEELDR